MLKFSYKISSIKFDTFWKRNGPFNFPPIKGVQKKKQSLCVSKSITDISEKTKPQSLINEIFTQIHSVKYNPNDVDKVINTCSVLSYYGRFSLFYYSIRPYSEASQIYLDHIHLGRGIKHQERYNIPSKTLSVYAEV